MDAPTAPHFERSALITIDVQVDVLEGQPLEIAGTSAVVPRIGRLCSAFRRAHRPIVHVVRLYLADGSNAELCRKELVRGPAPVLRPGTPGRSLAPGVLEAGLAELDDTLLLNGDLQHLGEGEVAMYKPRWGAFYGTDLEQHLMTMDIDTLVFAGFNFPNCPRTSIYEASERDYRVVMVDDAVAGLYPKGRDEMVGIGVQVLGSEAVLAALEELARVG